MIANHCHCNHPSGATGEARDLAVCCLPTHDPADQIVWELGPEFRPGRKARLIAVDGGPSETRSVSVEVRA